MGGFARIPIIEQQVATPRGPGPQLRSEAAPPPNPVAGAVADVAGVAEGFNKVLQVQADHQAILDQNDAEAAWKSGHQANVDEVRASGVPGPQWAQTVAEKDRANAEAILSDRRFKPLSAQLGPRFAQLQQFTSVDVARQAAVQAAKDQHDVLVGQQKGRSTESGANFVVNKDGAITDSPAAQAIDAKEASDLMKLYPNSPDVRAYHAQLYQDMKIQQRAEAIAVQSPATLSAYLKQAGDKISPAEQQKVLTMATEAQRRGLQAVDTAYDQKRAQVLNDYDAGKIGVNDLHTAADNKYITGDDFTRRAKVPYEMPSSPSAVTQAGNLLRTAKSDEDIAAAKAYVNYNPDIRGKERQTLTGQLEVATQHLKTDEGRAKSQALDLRDRYYQLSGDDRKAYNEDAPATVEQLRENALNQFEVQSKGEPPSKWPEIMRKSIETNPIDLNVLGKGTVGVTKPSANPVKNYPPLPKPLPTMTDAEKIAWMRAHPGLK